MRIVAIRGSNLASLAGDFAVELEASPLAGAGLFAITGPTGSGKSTILDALCLALFDAMPRLPGGHGVMVGRAEEDEGQRVRSTDVRSILRRGAAEGHAEVDFVGGDRRRYRARWTVRRARGRADGRLQFQEMSLTDMDTGARIGDRKTEVLEEIARRIGFTFEQFRRSVLLAQGDFAALLRAGSDERSSLLERITGTEIYTRLSVAAYRRADAERQALAALRARQADLSPLADDARAELEQAHVAAAEQRLVAEQRVAEAKQAVAWHARDAELAAALAAARHALRSAQSAWDAAAPRRVLLEQMRRAQPLRVLHDAVGMAAGHQAEAVGRFNLVTAELERARAALAGALQDRRVAAAVVAEQVERLAALEAQLGALDIGARRAEVAAAAAQRTAVREAIAFAAQVRSLVKRIEDGERGVASATQAQIEAEATQPQLASHLQVLQSRLDEARHAERLATAAAHKSAAQMRGLLSTGEPCPVCGATEHPWAHGAPPLDAPVAALRRRVEELDREQMELIRRQAENATKGEEATRRIQSLSAALATDVADLAGLRAGWDELVFVGKVGCDLSAPGADAVLQELLGRAEARLAAASAAETEGAALAAKVGDARTALDARRGQEQEGVLVLAQAQARAAAAQQAVTQGREDVERRDAEHARAKSRLEDGLARAGFAPESFAALLARDEAWVRDEEAALQTLAAALEHARAVLGERQQAAFAHAASQPSTSQGEAERTLEATTAALEQAGQTAVEAAAALRADDDRRLRSAELGIEIERQAEQSALWEAMNELIGSADGKKFRAYAQSLTLQALVGHANAHLADLARRYRLQRVPGSDLELQIVDCDMGDEVRSVHSLSGGESFLVSLALALGLASLSSQSTQVESLFIDEGFGTLDPETLDVAIASLDALQSLGRKVGVISHVPTLVERIGVQVRVSALGGGRSTVRVCAAP